MLPDTSMNPTVLSRPLSRTVSATVVVLVVAAGFGLMVRLSGVLFDLFVALVLGTAVRPLAERLVRHGLSRSTSAVVVFSALALFVVGAALVLLPALAHQATDVTTEIPRYLEGLDHRLESSSSPILRGFGRVLPSRIARPETGGSAGTGTAMDYVRVVGGQSFTVLAVLLLGFYWLADGEILTRTLLLAVSVERREGTRQFIEEAEAKVGGYVRGQFLVCSASATLASLAYLLIGVPNALLWGLFFGGMAVFPAIGAPVGAAPAVLFALSQSPGRALWVMVAAASIHVLQDYVLSPRLVGRSLGVNAFTVMLAVATFWALLGVPGAVLAIPMAAILQWIVERFLFSAQNVAGDPIARDRASVIRLNAEALAADVRRQARPQDEAAGKSLEPVADLIESIAKDLSLDEDRPSAESTP